MEQLQKAFRFVATYVIAQKLLFEGYERIHSGILSSDEIFVVLRRQGKPGKTQTKIMVLAGDPDVGLLEREVYSVRNRGHCVYIDCDLGKLQVQPTLLNGVPVQEFPLITASYM